MSGERVFLAEIEANPKPGPYADAIAAATEAGTEYWGIWSVLASYPMASYHLCELSHELMHKEAPISAALREMIAAYTSGLNACEFCRNAHAAVAAQLHEDETLVASILHDPEASAISEKDKALLRFMRKLTLQPGDITQEDTHALKQIGWDEPSIYHAIGACALFDYYNRFVSGNGVKLVSDAAFKRLGERMAQSGYRREQPQHPQSGSAAHA